MTQTIFFSIVGMILFILSLYALITQAHLLRKIIALNVMSSGVFMLFIAIALRYPEGATQPVVDYVPHALVLTGIVIAVSSSALALVLARRIRQATGYNCLPEELPPQTTPATDVGESK